jgi:signal transduction histidine kinase/PAS domain-containing protein
MSRTARLWLVVVPAALAAGGLAVGITISSDHQDLPRLAAVLTLLGGWSFIAAGLIARTRQPLNRTGLLLIAVGFWWLVSSLVASNDSALWTLGVGISAIAAGFLVHLLLAYPSGRLESQWERGVVATGYVLVALGNLPFLLVDRTPFHECEDCPTSVVLVSENDTAASVFTVLVQTLAVVFLLAVVATLFDRWHRSTPAARRGLTPVLLAGAITLVLFAISVGTQDLWFEAARIAGWAASVAFIGIPFLFLWGLLQSRLARADIGRALADGLAGGAPGWVRQLLHDPSAEVLYARGGPSGGYIDAIGRPREAAAEAGRAVTHIERRGRPLAAIVHDAALLDEPELLEQVSAAVGLEVERDKNLLALQASERRSRALLDALPDKMFRISGSGVILDIQESPGSRPTRFRVGTSIYDSSAPREHMERVMTTGRRALESGELQTIEWEVDLDGDVRHAEGRFIPSGENEFFVVIRDVTDRKRQEVERAALHRVALAVASESRPEQIINLVAEEVCGVLGADAASILRYEPGGDAAVVVGRWHKRDVEVKLASTDEPVPLAGAPIHLVYETGRPIRVDVEQQGTPAKFVARLRSHAVHSFVAAPITLAGRPWGVVAASLAAPRSFGRGAEERLGAFTQLVSLALANEEARGELEASRARLVTAGDEERRRLERNLHDGAQQRLVSLSLSLRLAQRKLAMDPHAAQELLSAAGLELGVALEELRELARGIHPAVLTERGLGPALQSLADRVPLPVELEVHTDERMPRRVEAAAYYVVSEALANVAKYAHASAVTVTVGRENGLAIVEVTDDGLGGADPQRGTGLRGLTDRIEALDGTLVVDSRPGEGTRIRAEVPETPRTIRNRGLAELLDTSHHDSQVEAQL